MTYYDEKERTGPAVMGRVGDVVPLPYGTWSLEAMDANGGWLASAVDVVRFASAFDDPAMCPILGAASIATMFARPDGDAGIEVDGNYIDCGWFVWPRDVQSHRAFTSSNGHIAGSSTYLMRRHDRVNWAVLFNMANGPDGRPLMLTFRDATGSALRQVTRWPTIDQFAQLL